MGKIIYITGGVRSGKSEFAEKMILSTNKEKNIYLATSILFDEEMEERVKIHKIRRDDRWVTIEKSSELTGEIENYKNENCNLLLDSLSDLISNQIILDKEIDWDNLSNSKLQTLEKKIFQEIIEFTKFIKNSNLNLFIVSNEVGMGMVPTYPMGRYFRDISGKVNQYVASISDEAYLVVSGMSLRLK